MLLRWWCDERTPTADVVGVYCRLLSILTLLTQYGGPMGACSTISDRTALHDNRPALAHSAAAAELRGFASSHGPWI
jgi:hypothetical protein